MIELIGSTAMAQTSKRWGYDLETDEGMVKAGAAAAACAGGVGFAGVALAELLYAGPSAFAMAVAAAGFGWAVKAGVARGAKRAERKRIFIEAVMQERAAARNSVKQFAESVGSAPKRKAEKKDQNDAWERGALNDYAKHDALVCSTPEHGLSCKVFYDAKRHEVIHAYDNKMQAVPLSSLMTQSPHPHQSSQKAVEWQGQFQVASTRFSVKVAG